MFLPPGKKNGAVALALKLELESEARPQPVQMAAQPISMVSARAEEVFVGRTGMWEGPGGGYEGRW